jgi:hypothetical protein
VALPALLLISFSPIGSDARVLKQVELFAGKYDLYTCGYGPAPAGVARHYEIPAELQVWRYDRRALITRRYEKAYWTNAAIAHAGRQLPVGAFDAILANDVDSVGLALSLKPACGVHADLHEYAPRQKEELLRWRLFVAPFMRWMCRSFVSRATSVTTVGQGIADEYSREFGFHAEVVTNAAPYAELSPGPVSRPIRLVHSGAGLRSRNITQLVDAVEAATAELSLDLYLTPNDPHYVRELAARTAGSARVTLHDPVPYTALLETLNGYDVGLHVLPPVSFNNKWALPNKFFDYVQARLGVIIGPSPEMARILQDSRFGAVCADFTTAALVRVLDGLTVDSVLGWKAASDAAAPRLSAETQVTGWDRAIRRLLKR